MPNCTSQAWKTAPGTDGVDPIIATAVRKRLEWRTSDLHVFGSASEALAPQCHYTEMWTGALYHSRQAKHPQAWDGAGVAAGARMVWLAS